MAPGIYSHCNSLPLSMGVTCSFLIDCDNSDRIYMIIYIYMYVIMLHQTVMSILWGYSLLAGFGEASCNVVSCLWRGLCGRELRAASSSQPAKSIVLSLVAWELNAANNHVSLVTQACRETTAPADTLVEKSCWGLSYAAPNSLKLWDNKYLLF